MRSIVGDKSEFMTTLSKKLQIKPEMIGGAFGCPDDIEVPFPALTSLKKGELDFVIVFVGNAADVAKYSLKATQAIKEDGILWFCYPKKSGKIKTDIQRDFGWAPIIDLGYEGCRQVAIDETWSALRFREPRFSKKK